VAGTDQDLLSSITSHVVSKLKGNSVKSTEEIALALRLKKAVSGNIQVTEKKTQDLATWIDNVVIVSQQRNLVLRGAFQNMQRQLDNLRGHFSAIAMRYFGDQQTYSTNLRPAVDDITNAADSLDKDSPDALNKMKEALKSNEHALTMFEQLVNGLQVNPLKAPEAHNEHPGDIIDRVVSFLQSAIYSPVLSLWKGVKSAIAGTSPGETSTGSRPRREESSIDDAQLATSA
jgi:ribosomal protein L17